MKPFIVLNWNVGGAKFLELPSGKPRPWKAGMELKCREDYRAALQKAIERLFEDHGRPDVVCLQEIVQYEENGMAKSCHEILDDIQGYKYFPSRLIDTEQFGAKAKWESVRRRGGWGENAFFSQGNGFLVSDSCRYCPMLSLDNGANNNLDTEEYNDQRSSQQSQSKKLSGVERVDLHPGLYFGNRNSEPRAAFVLHIVRPADPTNGQTDPLDIFVVNLHLTTLKGERAGIPDIDEKASQIRLNQLKVVLDNCISQYNEWRNKKYVFSAEKPSSMIESDTKDRLNPVWILAGDFNFTPESAEYQYLTRRNFVDLLHHEPTKASGLGAVPTITVDYIFAGPRHYSVKGSTGNKHTSNNQVITNNTVRISDHYPILAHVSEVFEH